jgi:glycosyltransferase involved in cell wall biosynthesis
VRRSPTLVETPLGWATTWRRRGSDVNVVYVASFPQAGTVTHLRTLAPSVAELGHEVHVVCATEPLASEYRGVGVEATVLELRHKFDLVHAARLRGFLRSADVVHTHDRRAGILARPLARALGARVVDTYHGLPEELAGEVGGPGFVPKGTSRRRLATVRRYLPLEAALARLGVVVVPSHALARFLAANGFPRDRLRVIPYGIDIRRTEPRAAHEPFVVATSAYLIERKGVDTLIAACARVSRPLVLEIFGDGELRPQLERQAKELGVAAHFRGNVADVRERLAHVDLFVLPTRGDNLPVAILEAMASAVPVVATRVGGIPELVVNGETGLLVDVDDSDAMAAAIDALAADQERRESFGRAGARRASDLFEAGAVARRMVDLYEEICA